MDTKPDEPADDEDTSQRAEFTEWATNVRALLDFVEAGPELFDLAYVWGSYVTVSVGCFDEETAPADLAAAARMMGHADKQGTDAHLNLVRRFGRPGLYRVELMATARREDVCERVEVGVETVEVPDPSAPPVPTITVTRPVYRWECAPVLAGGAEMQHERAS